LNKADDLTMDIVPKSGPLVNVLQLLLLKEPYLLPSRRLESSRQQGEHLMAAHFNAEIAPKPAGGQAVTGQHRPARWNR